MPFGRLKVRAKTEIVTLGRPVPDRAGRRIAPEDWNAVLRDPDTVTVDMRNGFESDVGTFEGAVPTNTVAFGDLPAWWEANRAAIGGRRVAMFCTGGIRCEKASAHLLGEGAADVVQLDGGILGYLDAVPKTESLWHGGCLSSTTGWHSGTVSRRAATSSAMPAAAPGTRRSETIRSGKRGFAARPAPMTSTRRTGRASGNGCGR